ncbi:unnamed protein product [Nippostrongylus brasiliensis]|uniref:Ovule protein n=1 Tax=Nippostrongylus brasiliensis TaxID=27835 RepID=A0A0N4YKA2_NIPBR|nr:unnamed protein product [Nippostrongylus brasiliensis]
MHISKQIIEKLGQRWNHFVCAKAFSGSCKVSDSIQICSYNSDQIIVMGMPLRFKESEQDVKESIMNWIIDCKASPKQTAQILKDIRKKVKSGDTGAAGSAFITAIAVLAAALVFNSW